MHGVTIMREKSIKGITKDYVGQYFSPNDPYALVYLNKLALAALSRKKFVGPGKCKNVYACLS